MSDGATGLDMAGIVGGSLTLLASTGAGIRWLFGRAERREKALDAKEAELVSKLEARIVALEARDEKREAEVEGLRAELNDTRTCLLILAQEVATTNPTSPALNLARKLLHDRFPIPSDMTDTLSKIG